MDHQDWTTGYRRLLTYRPSWSTPLTIQGYFAYIVVALALALAILAAMVWLALRPDKQHRQLKPVQKAMKSGVSGAFKPCVK